MQLLLEMPGMVIN